MCQAMDLAKNFANHILGIDSEVKEGSIIGNGFYPFVGLELAYMLSVVTVESTTTVHTFSKTFAAISSTFPGSLYRGTATVKSSPFFP